ncbi:hypothetical protein VCHA53O466_50064 [Vibrio chagasii]|nr:hypothetical protein VCHA53O466_50064 [Vibrio chagasii]
MISTSLSTNPFIELVKHNSNFLVSVPEARRTPDMECISGTGGEITLLSALEMAIKAHPRIIRDISKWELSDDDLVSVMKLIPESFAFISDEHKGNTLIATEAIKGYPDNIQYVPIRARSYKELRSLAWECDRIRGDSMVFGLPKKFWVGLCCLFALGRMYSFLVL